MLGVGDCLKDIDFVSDEREKPNIVYYNVVCQGKCIIMEALKVHTVYGGAEDLADSALLSMKFKESPTKL